MSSLLKPAWLKDPLKLLEITEHQLFMPTTIPNITTLKEEQPFISGIRQFLFWKGQLLPSVTKNTIFLAFLGPEGLKPPNVLHVTDALKNIIDLFQVCEFYQGANTCFLALTFNCSEPITQILSCFKYFNDSVVLSFTQPSSHQHRFRLLWLPPLFDINRVHHLLNKYTVSHRLRRESIPFAGNIYSPTNVLAGTLTVKPGIDISTLPHLIQLPAPHRGCALLSIEARPPLCLKCRAVGHTRSHCKMSRCPHCDKVHFPDSPCGVASYSSVASRNITPCSNDDWFAGLPDTSLPAESSITSNDTTSTLQVSPLIPPSQTSPETDKQPSNSTSHDSPPSTINNATECVRTHEDSHDFNFTDDVSHLHNSQPCHSEATTQPPDTAHLPLKPVIKLSIPYDTSIHDHHDTITSILNDTTSNPIASFSRTKETSKVHILDHPPPPSSIARSHLITYSTAGRGFTPPPSSSSQQLSSSIHSAVFGDSEPDDFFSSDVDLSSEPGDHSSPQDMLIESSTSRKRKVSLSPTHTPPDSSPPVTLDDVSSFTSPSFVASSTPISMESLDILIQPPSNLDLGPSSGQSALRQRVSSIFSADSEQVCLLEQLCPDGSFTSDIIKSLKLFFENGIFIPHILASPYILKLRFTEIKRKIGFLKKHLPVITIDDICQKAHLEDKVFAGASLTPTTFFT